MSIADFTAAAHIPVPLFSVPPTDRFQKTRALQRKAHELIPGDVIPTPRATISFRN
jgi:hypothetical protein